LPTSTGEHSTGGTVTAAAHADPRLTMTAKAHQVVEVAKRGVPATAVQAEVFRLPRTAWNEGLDAEVPWAPIRWQPHDVEGNQLITVNGKSPFIAPLLITLSEERKKRGPIVQGEAALKAQDAIKKLAAAAVVHVQRVAKDMRMDEDETREMLSPQRLASVFAGFIAQRQFIRSKCRTLGGGESED
jgi:hypothetical protein